MGKPWLVYTHNYRGHNVSSSFFLLSFYSLKFLFARAKTIVHYIARITIYWKTKTSVFFFLLVFTDSETGGTTPNQSSRDVFFKFLKKRDGNRNQTFFRSVVNPETQRCVRRPRENFTPHHAITKNVTPPPPPPGKSVANPFVSRISSAFPRHSPSVISARHYNRKRTALSRTAVVIVVSHIVLITVTVCR